MTQSENENVKNIQGENEPQGIGYPEKLTVSPSPHIKSGVTTSKIMTDVLVALAPALLFGFFIFGYRAAILTAVTVSSCVLFEFLYQKLMKKKVTVCDMSAAVTGVLLAMNLPAGLPYHMAVIGSFFAIVIVKQLFGGLGKNIVNPALAARVFLFLSFSSYMAKYPPLDGVASATPLAYLKNGDVSGFSAGDILRMFMGMNKSGVIGEISVMLLLAGGIYLIVRRVITWHIPVAYIGTVAAVTFLFPRGGADRLGFMLLELCSGGLILGAVFMATDYVTSPVTPKGRIIFGILCGLITVFIRYFGAYNEGVSFSILISNLLVYYIDKYTKPRVFGKKKKKLFSLRSGGEKK